MKRLGHIRRTIKTLLGIPKELIWRATGREWVSEDAVSFIAPCGEWSLTAPANQVHDGFSFAPNLYNQRGQISAASRIHDAGWVAAMKDDGSELSFDANNVAFRLMLLRENHAQWIVDLYCWGVGLDVMRRKWEAKHGHK